MSFFRMTGVVGLSAAVLAAPALAQQSDTARIAPMVVTATIVPISAAAAPATVSVITGEALRRQGITSVATALQSLPGVTFAQNGSFGATTSLFLRGGEAKYVKVLVDGVAINDPGGAIDFGALTTDNVDRIEIVRGPASVLYGADAVTGVIQIFTRRGRGAPHAVVSARAGTYDSRDVDASVLGGLPGGDFSAAIAHHGTRGIYAFNNGFQNSVASGNVHLLLDARSDLRITMRYNDEGYHYPTDGGGDVVDTNAHLSTERTVLSAELGRVFAPSVAAHLSLTSETAAGGTDDPQDTPAASGYESVDRTRRRGADLHADFTPIAATTFTLGGQVEQEDERTESQSVFGTFASTSVFSASRHNSAAYAQALATWRDSLVLTAGARLDDNERFGNFGTYRVGASWGAPTGTQLRASAGTAFREPTFAENYSTGYVTGNPNLSPERAVTWEVGLRQRLWTNRLTLAITHFDQRFRNMIDYSGATDACGASYCNVARASARGRELELRLAATGALSLDANLTHLETRVLTAGFDTTSGGLYREGEPLIRRPTTSWNVGGAFSGTRGNVDVRVTHVGQRTDRDFRPYPALPVVDPGYTLVDASGDLPLRQIAPRLPDAELTLRIENALDTTYQSVFNFLSPRRTILGGIRLTF